MQLLVTFAAFMILEDVQRLVWGVQPYSASDPVRLLGTVEVLGIPYNTYQIIVLPAVAVVILLGLRWFLRHTLSGRLITAVTEDREAAIAMGIGKAVPPSSRMPLPYSRSAAISSGSLARRWRAFSLAAISSGGPMEMMMPPTPRRTRR